MKKITFQLFRIVAVCCLLFSTSAFAVINYPQWSFEMKVWPFDILYPFQTGFASLNGKTTTSDNQIKSNLDIAVTHGANVVIFYIDDEQSFETFVDEAGFTQTINRIQYLVDEAHNRNLKVVCYLNGLEVIAVGAKNNSQMPTLARNHPDWLQIDINGVTNFLYTNNKVEWIPAKSEDAWATPLSPWKDMFTNRLVALSTTGLDGVYIDATFLPGIEGHGFEWSSIDSAFAASFNNKYGLTTPVSINWNSEIWRKWIFFRHEIIRDYLSELANTACAYGMVPFFESSSCDTSSGTYLANDNAFTINGGIACSPEIEPEGDFKAAFRMSKVTRDANQKLPFWFLGWPDTAKKARREFSITLCHSGNYYPSAEATDYFPTNSFDFIDLIREPILNKRVPKQNTILVYPMRSKDYTYENDSSFDSYVSAFKTLAKNHIDFRIMSLDTMTSNDLTNINTVVLAGAESISDNQYNLIKNKTISLIGQNGVNDEWGNTRAVPLSFLNVINIDDITPKLPFSIVAPSTTYIEYYVDKTVINHFFIFAYNNNLSGNIQIDNSTLMTGKVYEMDNSDQEFDDTTINIKIVDYLDVIDLRITDVPEPGIYLLFTIYNLLFIWRKLNL